MTTETKIGSGFALALAIIMALGLNSYVNTQRLLEANRWVAHTHLVLEKLEHVLSVLKDAETSQRGFMLTGEESYLEPYRDAGRQIQSDIEALQGLTRDNAEQQASLAQVGKHIAAKLDELGQTIELRRKSGPEAALQVIRTGRDRQLMDELRREAGEMQTREQVLLKTRNDAADASARSTRNTLVLWTPLSLLLLAAVGVFVTQRMRFGGPVPSSVTSSKKRSMLALRYAFALVVVALAAALRLWLLRAFGPMPLFITFYPAVVLTASVAGGGPGILASMLAALAAAYFFIEPYGHLAIAATNDMLALSIFTGVNLFLCVFAERLRRARQAEAVSAAQEEELVLRRRTEAALRESEERFRTMADAMPQLAWIAQADGFIFWYNRRWYQYTGTTPEQMEGWGWQSVHDPQTLPAVLERWKASIASGEPFDMTFPLRGADGVFRPFLTRVMPLKDAAGHVVQWFGTNTDVTERMEIEESLRQQREWLRVTLTSIGDGVITCDTAGRVTFLNPVAEALSGWNTGEALGQPIQSVFRIINEQTREPAADIVGHVLRDKIIVELANHTALVRKDGGEVSIEDSAAPIMDGGGSVAGVVLVFHDVSDQRLARQELRIANAQLAEADRRKDEFLAMLAHELRNPLAPIRNAVQVLRLAGSQEAVVQRQREIIDRQTTHMAHLVDDLLDVSRITQGKIELKKTEVNLAEVLAHAVETITPLVESRRHTLALALPPEDLRLSADPDRLAQIVGNLLANAAKYTPEGGRIWLEAAREDEAAVLRVRDDGAGMNPDILPHIFDLFIQADQGLARAQGGLGIGLTMVRSLAQMHGGQVEAYSAGEGRGSEFIVRLPALPPQSPGSARAEAPAAACSGSSPLRILVVDDVADSVESLSDMLALWGHEVRKAFGGPEALAAARDFRPELVLLDIGMPGMNGYEVAHRLREEHGSSFKLVALTGYAQDHDRGKSHEAGFNLHLAKPVDVEALGKLLAQLSS